MEISFSSEGIYLASDCVNHVPSSICPILNSDEIVTQATSHYPGISSTHGSANATLATG